MSMIDVPLSERIARFVSPVMGLAGMTDRDGHGVLSHDDLKPQILWLRVFVEGVVIVGSILLTFGIDA